MSKLADRVKITLDESRMLVLGSQVLVGFQLRGSLETAMDSLSELSRYLYLVALILLIVTLALLMLPAAYHRIVSRGRATHDLQSFSTGVMSIALLPFAIALGLDLFVVFERVGGFYAGLAAGILGGLMAVLFWYGIELFDANRHKDLVEGNITMQRKDPESESEKTPLNDKISQVLTETRMVLPGAQALLGFGLVATFMSGFDKLPEASKLIHLASLATIAFSTILLMMPAAYHRIVERGQDTERFHRLASRMLLAAMVFLALGIVLDFYVVMHRITGLTMQAIISSILLLLLFYGLWFAYTYFRRLQLDQKGPAAKAAEPRRTDT